MGKSPGKVLEFDFEIAEATFIDSAYLIPILGLLKSNREENIFRN